jgi:FkbM family methyltransferase
MNKKVFIDGGFHLGEGLSEFKIMLGITNDWVIHAFEPNLHCNGNLINDNNIIFHRKAIWVENGSQMFNCEDNNATNSPKVNSVSNLDGWGSCLSTIESTHTFGEQILVETIDFSEFINNFKDCEIYCKLDIEGAEFEVLRKLIKTGGISLIKELWVEWHEMDLPTENENTMLELVDELSKYTKINNWK